jgi:RNA polymerase sigma factor (sigma-70 family)
VDKSRVLASASYDPFDEEEVSPEVQRLRDVVATMTDRQKQVYQLVLLEERGYTEVAKFLDCSAANVKQICNKVIALIKAGV